MMTLLPWNRGIWLAINTLYRYHFGAFYTGSRRSLSIGWLPQPEPGHHRLLPS